MFNELKNKLYKMILTLGGIFSLIIFFGIFLGSYFSFQRSMEDTLHDSFKTATQNQAVIPQKESCVLLLIYVDENNNILKNEQGNVDYEIYPYEFENDIEFKTKYSWWFNGLATSIDQTYQDDNLFKFNNKRYIFNNISYTSTTHPEKRCMLYSILDYSSYYSNFQVTFFSLLIGYCLVILLLSFSSVTLADKIVAPVHDAFVKQKDLIANASHELKTPLTIISTNTSIILEHQDETIQSQEKWISSSKQQVDRMNQLIQQMLYLSKTESMFLVEQHDEVNLSESIKKIAMEFDSVAFEQKIHIQLNIQKDVLYYCNQNSFNNLVTILLDNAIKYNNENGVIKITLTQKKNKIEMIFFNTGKGIEKENLEKIFQRFYKEDKAFSKNSHQSFGLGLAIAKAIVTQMNGSIYAESEKNVYTQFIIKLQKKGLQRKK